MHAASGCLTDFMRRSAPENLLCLPGLTCALHQPITVFLGNSLDEEP